MIRIAVYGLFLLSGATALVYEVAWSRALVRVLGSTTQAVSLILAVYMLGLALGARLFGPWADRSRRPLLLYAVLEAGIGLLVFLLPPLFGIASWVAGGSRLLALLLTFAVLLIPTTLMGGTLPVLSRFVVTGLRGMGGRIGLLYGLNTAGAVLGTFLSGFFLVRLLGVFGSTFYAGAVNLLIALAAGILAVRMGPLRDREEEVPDARPSPASGTSLIGIALIAAFASGLVGLASEVLWTRMLTFFLEGFTYTFAAMLTTFLLGLSLGALLSGQVVNRIADLRRYLGWLFVAAAVASACVLYALAHHFALTKWAKDVTAGISENWRVHHAASLLLASFVVLFPPALLLGGIFPAAARMATRSLREVGATVGSVYAVNTLGAVLGSLLSGLVLAPLLGMAWAAALIAVVGLAVGLFLLGRRLLPALPLAAVAVSIIVLTKPGTPFILRSHVFHGERGIERKLLSYEEGAYAAVSVVEDRRNGVRAIYTDEFQAAATGPQYKYMRMLAHLPLLLSPRWEEAEVLIICFGTGTTAGSASVHPLGRLDLVEICQEVLDQAHRFRDVNKGILDEGRDGKFPVDVHVRDGRNFLLRSDRRWDVISLEPLMPYTPGAVNLYTEDFYSLCRDRLAEGGVMCQWFPIHSMESDDYKMLLRSFVHVFPHSTLWFVEGTSLLIGSAEPLPIDFARMRRRIQAPGVSEDLRAIHFDDPVQVLNSYVAGGAALRDVLADAKLMTDEHPFMEFHPIPYGFVNTYAADNLAVLQKMRTRVSEVVDLSGVSAPEREEIQAALERCYQGGQAFLEARHFKEMAAYFGAIRDRGEQSRYFRMSLQAYDRAVELNPDDASARYLRRNARYGWEISRGLLQLKGNLLDQAIASFRDAAGLENPFKGDLAWTYLGRALNRRGRPDEALEALEEALVIYPGSPTALAERGYAWYRLGFPREAFTDFSSAYGKPVRPETDATLDAAVKRVLNKAEKGLLPSLRSADETAGGILEEVRRATADKRSAIMRRLRAWHLRHPGAVQAALAADLRRSRAPESSPTEQLFGLKVLLGLGDLPGTLDLLRTGTVRVKEHAADMLGHVKEAEVVPALIDAMEDHDAGVREAAWASLFGLTGNKAEGYAPRDPPEKRAPAVSRLRDWWGRVKEVYEFPD